jgi:hypothetical protein
MLTKSEHFYLHSNKNVSIFANITKKYNKWEDKLTKKKF